MIQKNLSHILSKLPPEVTLVAVSKFHPVQRLMVAYDAGQRVFAESRPQELAQKVPQMPSDVQWHFIGHLQTNKLKLVLPYVTLVQSVDSLHLLQAISDWAVANTRTVDVLLELHLGSEETKQGFTEDEILRIVSYPSHSWSHGRLQFSEPVSAPAGIRIRGLMGMASNTDDMSIVEGEFAKIEALFNRIKAMGLPDFDQLSIGMSNDWPHAVKHGATMVRIGTDIFGPREY